MLDGKLTICFDFFIEFDLSDIDSLESWLSHAAWYDHNYREHYRIPAKTSTPCSEKMSVVCAKESNSTAMTLKSINHSIKPFTSYAEKHSDDLSMTLKPPKSYGTYSEKQQEDVVAFIKDGNSLRTAEKVFGIPKSTMHCWLKKRKLKFEIVDSDGNAISSNSDTCNSGKMLFLYHFIHVMCGSLLCVHYFCKEMF